MIFGNPVRQAYIRPPGAKPIAGSFRVTQDFGPTSVTQEPSVQWAGGEDIPARFYSHFHKGADLGNLKCGADVLAVAKGIVRYAGKDIYGGTYVLIDHGGGWGSIVGHLSHATVSKGQKVSRGQKVGVMGSTGNSTGCHVHLGVKSGVDWSKSFFLSGNGKWRDPWPRLAQNVTVVVKQAGINIRASAGSGTTSGSIFATANEDGLIHRSSDGESLGPWSQRRKWGGTVTGAEYEVNGVKGKTWEKIDLDGGWRFVASPLVVLSQT